MDGQILRRLERPPSRRRGRDRRGWKGSGKPKLRTLICSSSRALVLPAVERCDAAVRKPAAPDVIRTGACGRSIDAERSDDRGQGDRGPHGRNSPPLVGAADELVVEPPPWSVEANLWPSSPSAGRTRRDRRNLSPTRSRTPLAGRTVSRAGPVCAHPAGRGLVTCGGLGRDRSSRDGIGDRGGRWLRRDLGAFVVALRPLVRALLLRLVRRERAASDRAARRWRGSRFPPRR